MKERPALPKSWLITITVGTLIMASFLNDYLLEDWLFPGNNFNWVNKFYTVIELFFLTYAIDVFLTFKAIGLLFKVIFTGQFKYKSPGLKKELRKMSWPVFPAMIIYGILSGTGIYLLTDGYSFSACIIRSTLLSTFWGVIYAYCWRRGYLMWFFDERDEDEEETLGQGDQS